MFKYSNFMKEKVSNLLPTAPLFSKAAFVKKILSSYLQMNQYLTYLMLVKSCASVVWFASYTCEMQYLEFYSKAWKQTSWLGFAEAQTLGTTCLCSCAFEGDGRFWQYKEESQNDDFQPPQLYAMLRNDYIQLSKSVFRKDCYQIN